jgi:hypothetical protein
MAKARKPNPKIRNRANSAKRRKLMQMNHEILKKLKESSK